MARPIFQSEAFIFPTTRMNVDFDLSRKLPLQTEQVGVGAEWDVATWDEANWVIGDVASKDWISIEGIGISGGLNISTSSSGIKYNWISTDVIFEVGGSL
jgi:hypothetical protein